MKEYGFGPELYKSDKTYVLAFNEEVERVSYLKVITPTARDVGKH
jgi:hypothetical protein